MSQGIKNQFRNMGLTEEEIRASMHYMLEDEDDLDEGELIGDEDEDEDEDIVSVAEAYKKVRKLRGKKKMQAKKYRRSAAGKKSAKKAAKKMKRVRRTSAYKRRQAKLAKTKVKKGYRRVVSDRDVDAGDGMLEDIMELAESINSDVEDRFAGFVEAFNHIADIGELLTYRYHTLEEDAMAEDVIGITTDAEDVISYLEDLDGVLSPDEDEILEDKLSEMMEIVAEALEDYDVITEGEDFDDDDDDYEEYDEYLDWEDEDDDEEDDDYPF